MKLTYLGTAAAEGWPALFCHCDHCDRARKAGGRNIRTRSQSIINDDLLIDFPADSYMHALVHGIDLSAVKYLLITHPHSDHLAPMDLSNRSEGIYAHNVTEKTLVLAGPPSVIEEYRHFYSGFADEVAAPNIMLQVMENYRPYTFGEYTVTPLRANHMDGQKASCYHITDGQKTLLYFHDTGMLFDEVWAYLEKNHIRADFISLDCTCGITPDCGCHLGLADDVLLKQMFLEKGIADAHTRFCINHFSHNGAAIYDEMVPLAEKEGFMTAFDGMQVDI